MADLDPFRLLVALTVLAEQAPAFGGRIGQPRLCMFFLRTAHIGEVACSIWPQEMQAACEKANITLL